MDYKTTTTSVLNIEVETERQIWEGVTLALALGRSTPFSIAAVQLIKRSEQIAFYIEYLSTQAKKLREDKDGSLLLSYLGETKIVAIIANQYIASIRRVPKELNFDKIGEDLLESCRLINSELRKNIEAAEFVIKGFFAGVDEISKEFGIELAPEQEQLAIALGLGVGLKMSEPNPNITKEDTYN